MPRGSIMYPAIPEREVAYDQEGGHSHDLLHSAPHGWMHGATDIGEWCTEFLITHQNNDGGWDYAWWPDWNPTNPSPINQFGIQALGLYRWSKIYPKTEFKQEILDALEKTLDWYDNRTFAYDGNRPFGHDMMFLGEYSQGQGDSVRAEKAAEAFLAHSDYYAAAQHLGLDNPSVPQLQTVTPAQRDAIATVDRVGRMMSRFQNVGNRRPNLISYDFMGYGEGYRQCIGVSGMPIIAPPEEWVEESDKLFDDEIHPNIDPAHLTQYWYAVQAYGCAERIANRRFQDTAYNLDVAGPDFVNGFALLATSESYLATLDMGNGLIGELDPAAPQPSHGGTLQDNTFVCAGSFTNMDRWSRYMLWCRQAMSQDPAGWLPDGVWGQYYLPQSFGEILVYLSEALQRWGGRID